MISYKCSWDLTVFYPPKFQALIIVHYVQVVTLSMALNLPLNTLGLLITYNVLNFHIQVYSQFDVGIQWDRITIHYLELHKK